MARRGIVLDAGSCREGYGEVLVVRLQDQKILQKVLNEDPYARERLVAATSVYRLDDLMGQDDGPERPESAEPGSYLSAHERRIASMMLDGLTNRQIAEHFLVSPRAVEQHITRIYRKLMISRRAQLADALRHHSAPVA